MSTGYGWEGLRQLCAKLLCARHVPERLSAGFVYLGCTTTVWPLPFDLYFYHNYFLTDLDTINVKIRRAKSAIDGTNKSYLVGRVPA